LIKVTEDLIEITFLKQQFDERGHVSKKNSENGSMGGAPKGNKNAEKNNPKQPKTTNIEEEREREEEREVEVEENKNNNMAQIGFATTDQRSALFMNKLKPYIEMHGKEMLRAFYDYWTEKNENGKKMRFEMQKVFDINRRLTTWAKNNKFNGKQNNTPQTRADQLEQYFTAKGNQ